MFDRLAPLQTLYRHLGLQTEGRWTIWHPTVALMPMLSRLKVLQQAIKVCIGRPPCLCGVVAARDSVGAAVCNYRGTFDLPLPCAYIVGIKSCTAHVGAKVAAANLA